MFGMFESRHRHFSQMAKNQGFSLFLAIFCCFASPKDEAFFTLYEVFFTPGMTRSMPRNPVCHTSLFWLVYWRFAVLCFSCFGYGMPRFAKLALRNSFFRTAALQYDLLSPLLNVLVLCVYLCAVRILDS